MHRQGSINYLLKQGLFFVLSELQALGSYLHISLHVVSRHDERVQTFGVRVIQDVGRQDELLENVATAELVDGSSELYEVAVDLIVRNEVVQVYGSRV